MGGRDGLQLQEQAKRLEMDQRKHSKQLWDHGVKMFHNLQRWGRSRMMKIRGGLKVGIHWIRELVDIV